MKQVQVRLLIALMLTLALHGCSGGGGGGAAGPIHAPTLSNVVIVPDHVDQNYNNGSIPVYFSAEFKDSGGDIQSVAETAYNNKGALVHAESIMLKSFGTTSGVVTGGFTLDTKTAGNYSIQFVAVDSTGMVSKPVTTTFTVVPPLALASIDVTPATPAVDAWTELQFTATGFYNNNTTQDLTGLVTWTSSDPAIATINDLRNGQARAINGGSTTITATLGSISGHTLLTVLSAFGPVVNYPGMQGHNLSNTAIGDLNGDGRNDVAVMEQYGGNMISLYYQKMDHTMDYAQFLFTDLSVRNIAIADVNHDGLADLVVSSDGGIAVFTQDAFTHALTGPQYYVIMVGNTGLSVADLNNDGLLDIAVSGADMYQGYLSLLFQNAGGTLDSAVTYTSFPIFRDGELHVADMNNDGLNDIVIQSGVRQLAVIKQLSPGVFSTLPEYYTTQSDWFNLPTFVSFALGDLNGDGLTDIVMPDGNGMLSVFLQHSSGPLIGPTTINRSGNEIHIADIDGDGLNDIILPDLSHGVTVLFQAQDHTFTNAKFYPVPTSTIGGYTVHQAASIGDVTGDGLPDIVTTWSADGIYVLPHLP